MKKVALLSCALLMAMPLYSNNTARAKGTVKLVGSAGLGIFSLFTLRQSYATFQASRQASTVGWKNIEYWFPKDKTGMRSLAGYQLGTTGFAAICAKQLYESGMNDFNQAHQ